MKQTIIAILMVLSAALSFAGDSMPYLGDLSGSTVTAKPDPLSGDIKIYVDKDSIDSLTTNYLTTDIDDVRKALELAVKYLVPVDLSVTYSVVDTRSEADKLRMLADEMEQKQKDIEYIKSVLKALNN